MLIEYFLVAIVLISLLAVFWFYREADKLKQDFQQIEAKLQIATKGKEEIQTSYIRSNAENVLYQKQLADEKASFIEQKEFLSQQLQLMGKDLVEQGSKALKTESHQKLNELLHPFKEKLALFEREVRENHKRDIEQYSNMSAVVKTLS